MTLFSRLALAATMTTALAAALPPAAQAQQSQAFASDERFFLDGLDLFDRGQYGAARQSFRRYLDQSGRRTDFAPGAGDERRERTADAEYYDAVAGLHLEHPDAEGAILDFARRHPVHPRAALAYLELAKFYFNQKNYPQAVAYFQRVAPGNLSAAQRAESDFKLAYSYFEQRDYAKARLLFDRNKQGPGQYRYASAYYAGYLAYRAGDYAAARQDLSVAEQNDAYRPVVPAVMAQIYYKEANYDDLISYAAQALKSSPPPQNADEIQLLVGDAYYQKQDYKEAAGYFDRYAAGKKRIEPALQYKIGFANYKTGDFPGAIAALKPVAARRDSLGQNAAYHLGLSYLQTDQKPYALAAFDAARQSTQEPAIGEQATLKLGQVHYELGNLPEVIAALKDFQKKFPRSKNQLAVDELLSTSFLSSPDYQQALTYLESLGTERSDRLNATYQRVAYAQAASFYNDGQYAEALPLLERSLNQPQDDALRAAAQVLRGEIYSVGQRYPEAIAAYVAAGRQVRRGGVSAEEADFEQKARYGLGYAYYNTKQYERARPQFQAFLSDADAKPSDPNYYDATLRLADTYYVTKSYSTALDLYDKVIQANAADKDYAYYQKGVTLGAMGRRDEATKTLAALLKTSPGSRYAEQAGFQQAQLDFEAGDYGPAAAGFTRLLDNRPAASLVPAALQKRGVSYANLAQHERAVADFQRILTEFPRSESAAQAIYSLQESLTALGRTEELDAALNQFKGQNPNSRATESVEFEAAKSLYLAGKYAPALTRLLGFLTQYPASALNPDARYFLADSYLKTGDQTEALTRLRAVAEEGRSAFVNRAVGRVADLEFEAKNYAEAIKYYQRLKTASANRREVATATLGLLRASYESGDFAATRAVAEELRGLAGATANATNAALLYLGKASLRQNNLDQAAAELRAAVAAAPADINGAEAQYLLGQALLQQKKYPDALAEALKVNSRYASYELWQGRAFLLVAEIYAAQGEIFQARGTLNSIIDNKFPVAEIVAAARQRLLTLPADDASANPESDRPELPAPVRTPPAKPAPAKPAPAKTPAPAGGKAPLLPRERTPPIVRPAPRQ